MKALGMILALLLAGCAAPGWYRADGAPTTPEIVARFEADYLLCGGLYNAHDRSRADAYAGDRFVPCMQGRGWEVRP
jgi:hypothetical protein